MTTHTMQRSTLGHALAGMRATTAGAYAALAVVLIGSVGPWATTPLASVSGVNGDGKITALLALVTIVIVALAGLAPVVPFLGLLILGIAVYDTIHIAHVASQTVIFGAQIAHVGWGVYAVIAGGVLALCAVAWDWFAPQG